MEMPQTAAWLGSAVPIQQHILEEAAGWLALLQDGSMGADDRRALHRWCRLSPEHQRAWQRAQRLLVRFDDLPTGVTRSVLDAASRAGGSIDAQVGDADGAGTSRRRRGKRLSGRRRVARGLGLLLVASPLAGWLWQRRHELPWLAGEHVTSFGQVREWMLTDGSRIILNADSRLDEDFSDAERLLQLQRGEVFIQTAEDPAAAVRPFRVRTAQGTLQALGTRFSVRQTRDATWLAVYQGAVRVSPDRVPATGHITLSAGRQLRFSADHVDPPWPVQESATAWRQGLLVARDMMLSDWADELSRFSGQSIRVREEARGLRISGTFPLRDPRLALQMLAGARHVTIRLHADGADIGVSGQDDLER